MKWLRVLWALLVRLNQNWAAMHVVTRCGTQRALGCDCPCPYCHENHQVHLPKGFSR